MAFPWDVLITGLTGLGGVAVGGGITYLLERRKWQRDQQVDAYAKLLEAADLRWNSLLGWVLISDLDKRVEHIDEVNTSASEWFRVRTRSDLVISAAAREIVEELEEANKPFTNSVFDWTMKATQAMGTGEPLDEIQPTFEADGDTIERHNRARAAFIEQARKDLGLD